MLGETYATSTTWHLTSYPCSDNLPWKKIPQIPSFKGRDGPIPLLQPDNPENPQVGAYSAAVYTTKIRLALARVSKQQSQPFMVRVGINIAESRTGGVVQPANTFMDAGLNTSEHNCPILR